MDRFLEMQSFRAVVEMGSFVKAAESLGLSKAAVSRHVGELEARLGVRLLHRTTRRLSLTDEGSVFNERCRTVLGGLEEAEAEITSRSSGVARGLLRINAPVTFGITHLAPVWAEFHQRYPQVELDISLSDRVVDVVDEGYDLAIRIATLPSSSLISKRLASTRMVLCASPGYLQSHGRPTHPSELVEHQVMGYSYWSSGDKWQFNRSEDLVSVTLKPWMHTNNGDTCLALALAGEGIILQPSFMVNSYLANGQLVELMPEYKSIELGIYAVYPSRKHITPKLRALIDFLFGRFSTQASF